MPYPLKWTSGIVISGSDWNDVRLYQPASYIVWVENSVYYAKGCYSGSTDYSGSSADTVVQNVLNTLTDRTVGGKVFFMIGNYNFATGIVISGSMIRLEGEQWGIDHTNGVSFTFTKVGDGDCVKYTTNARQYIGAIENISIYGYALNGDRNGIHVEKNFSDLMFDQLYVHAFSGSAIKMEATGSGQTKIWNIWIKDTLIEANNYGIYMVNAGDTVNQFIDRVFIIGGHWYANINSLRIENAWVNNVVVDRVSSELDRQHCIYLNGGRHMTITNCHIFDGSTDLKGRYDGIYLTGSWTQNGGRPGYINIVNNDIGNHYVSGNYRYSVNLDGIAENIRVENNIIDPFPITTSSFKWCGNTGSYVSTDIGKVNSLNFLVKNNIGYITEDSGIANSIADGGSVAHNLSLTPTTILATQNAVTTTVTKFTASASGSRGIYFYHDGSGTASFWWKVIGEPVT